MLVDGLDAGTAAFQVGYESATQFSREYRRVFGRPPLRDIKALRFVSGLTRTIRRDTLSTIGSCMELEGYIVTPWQG
jgi:AraC-like DNA-binding protein